MNRHEIESMLNEHVPDAFLRRALQAVFTAHRVSYEYVTANLPKEEAANLLPYHRRAKLEEYLRDAASVSGLRSSVSKSPGSGWFHTEVTGGPVVMTASAVPVPCGDVDPSEFRLSLAKDNELYLWSEPWDVVPEDAPLYALLLHSRGRWQTPAEATRNAHLPGSAYLAFPVPGLTSYIHEINLYERFPDVVAAMTPAEWDEEALVRYIFNSRKRAIS